VSFDRAPDGPGVLGVDDRDGFGQAVGSCATALTEGLVEMGVLVRIRSQNPDHAVIFGDGIEADRIPLDWGQEVTIGPAAERLSLVA
jgi:hypothetical protein